MFNNLTTRLTTYLTTHMLSITRYQETPPLILEIARLFETEVSLQPA
ncbi:hypothetical protein Lepto7375DRAFT_5070 [Leptolyngbya sp. PCC 7375]|nr:hypothetical protein Lepto7375DRAFT_5070 [Leptolyngbya sp. PCC 7375]